MNPRNHPEVQILLVEIEKLLKQNEEMQKHLESVADQLIRLQLEYDRVIEFFKALDIPNLPGCPPEFRLEKVSNTIKAIESLLDSDWL